VTIITSIKNPVITPPINISYVFDSLLEQNNDMKSPNINGMATSFHRVDLQERFLRIRFFLTSAFNCWQKSMGTSRGI